jgi:hypothetical protein
LKKLDKTAKRTLSAAKEKEKKKESLCTADLLGALLASSCTRESRSEYKLIDTQEIGWQHSVSSNEKDTHPAAHCIL